MGEFGIGQSIKRFEDGRLLRGGGRFHDDVNVAGQLHAVIIRSIHAHARIRGIDTAAARQAPGVVAIFTGSDLDHLCDIGVATPGGQEQADQEAQRASLCRLLEDEGLLAPGERSVEAIVAALYGFLTRTPAMLVAATLEDAVESHDRPNVPGTIDQRPNWSLPLPVPLDDLAADPRVRRLAGILSEGPNRTPAEAERKS